MKFDKEVFKELITNMTEGFDKEHLESPLFKHIMDNSEYLDDPDKIYTMITYPFERSLELAISTSQKQKREVTDLWLDYEFLERNVSELCSQFYGSGCSVDRGRFLVKSYIKFKTEGVMPELDWKQQYTYHYPKTGTLKQWFDFIFGVTRLRHGLNKEYLLALQELTTSNVQDANKEEEYEQ